MTFAEEIDGRTIIAFTRARVTNDSAPIDVSLDAGRYFLWATGSERNFDANDPLSIMQHSFNSRGVSSGLIPLPSAAECPVIGKSNISTSRVR